MRAFVVLAAIVSLGAPEASARTIELQSPTRIELSLAAPASTPPQVHRTVSKAEKDFGFGGAIVPDASTILLPNGTDLTVFVPHQDPPNLDLDGPPLAPRPPPL